MVAVICAKDLRLASCTVRCVPKLLKDLGSDAEISLQSFLVLAHGNLRELGSIASQVNTVGAPNVIGLLLIFVAGIWLPKSGNQLHDLLGVPLVRIRHSHHGSDSDNWSSIHE